MRKNNRKIWISLLSLASAVCCFAAIGGNREVKSQAATQLPASYATLSNKEATFAYETLPEDYQNVFTAGSGAQKELVKGAMVFSAFNPDSSTGMDVSLTFSTVVSAKQLYRSFNLFEYIVIDEDLKEISDYNKDNPAFSSISITLTEKANPNNFVKISNVPSRWHNYQSTMFASATKVSSAGVASNGSFYDSSGFLCGTAVRGSLSGAYLNGANGMRDIYSVSHRYSFEENAAYAFPSPLKNNDNTSKDALVREFSSKSHMITANDQVFNGFTSDELTATITFDGLKGHGKIAILGFNGLKLYGDTEADIVDITAPKVYADNYQAGVAAEVGVSFPVFNFAAYDDVDGLTAIDSYKVYYNYGKTNQTEVLVENDRFIPEASGNYTIVAEKTDSSNNKGTALYIVEAKKKLPPFILSLQGEIQPYGSVGHKVVLPEATVEGGTVGTTYELHVYLDGKEIALDKWNGFLLSSQGLYVVRYSVYDYRKVPVDFDYFIEAKLDESIVVDFPTMPKYVAVGTVLKMPKFSAIDWYSYGGVPYDAIVTATVTKAGGEPQAIGEDYEISEKGEFTYTLTAKTLKGNKSVSQDYTITAIEPEFVSDYFIKNKIGLTEYEEELVFKAQENDATLSFINPLPLTNYTLKFNIPEPYKNFGKLTMTFYDRFASNERVTIECRPNGNTSFIKLNGQDVKTDSGFGGRDFSFSFKNTKLYNAGYEVGEIKTYDNGEAFVGFSSGFIYVDFEFSELNGDAGFIIKTLGNHSYFEDDATDISAPILNIASEIKSIIYIGQIIKIPTITAYDVFEGEKVVKVRVLLNKGDDQIEVPLVNNSFAVTDFGTYVLRLETTDSTGHRTISNKNMYCYNQTGPTITVLGKVPTECKLNESVTIANATAVDYFGEEVEVDIFVLKKGGAYVELDDNNAFTPTQETDYVVWYTAKDKDYNTTIIKFTIRCKK